MKKTLFLAAVLATFCQMASAFNLHKKLLEENIPHEFYSRPGKHNWSYWFNAIKYQFLFFNDRFIR